LNALWQPLRTNTHALEAAPNNATVLDPTTGLQWLHSGSDFPMDWHAAFTYIDDLNARQWGGHSDWRLPTVEELLTILRPPHADTDYCLPSTFATAQKRLWSSDRRTYTSAWYVSLELGFVAWQDKTFANHVKAVRRR
jgi:serine/threonine-protein kinase